MKILKSWQTNIIFDYINGVKPVLQVYIPITIKPKIIYTKTETILQYNPDLIQNGIVRDFIVSIDLPNDITGSTGDFMNNQMR